MVLASIINRLICYSMPAPKGKCLSSAHGSTMQVNAISLVQSVSLSMTWQKKYVILPRYLRMIFRIINKQVTYKNVVSKCLSIAPNTIRENNWKKTQNAKSLAPCRNLAEKFSIFATQNNIIICIPIIMNCEYQKKCCNSALLFDKTCYCENILLHQK